MHSRTRQEWNVSLRAGWFKSPSHLNKGPLCELKFFLYSSFVPPTHLSLTHLWSMTVTRSLGKSVSFLGSANSLIACTSLGLACGGRQERIDVTCRKVRRLSGIFMRQEQQSLLWFEMKRTRKASDLRHHRAELGKAGSVCRIPCPALSHYSV